MSASVACGECNETIRKECYLSHVKKNHPTFFWNDLLCFYPDKSLGLRTKAPLRNLIEILEGHPQPYLLIGSISDSRENNELYLDASSGCVYTKVETAAKWIGTGKDKHKDKFFEVLRDSITPEILCSMVAYMVDKPTEKIMDTQLINRKDKEIRELQKEIEKQKTLYNELHKQYDEIRDDDYLQRMEDENDKLKTKNVTLDAEIDDLYTKISRLQSELKQYTPSADQLESQNTSRLNSEIHEWGLLEKARKQHQKELEKLTQDNQKKTEKIEKLEEKHKKDKKKNESLTVEIETLKYQMKKLKRKAKQGKTTPNSESDSSSESGSDSE